MTSRPSCVSAHAVLRYLERVHSVDVEALRREYRERFPAVEECGDAVLLTWIESRDDGACATIRQYLERICLRASSLGARAMILEGVRFVFKDGMVCTVMTKELLNSRRRRR